MVFCKNEQISFNDYENDKYILVVININIINKCQWLYFEISKKNNFLITLDFNYLNYCRPGHDCNYKGQSKDFDFLII